MKAISSLKGLRQALRPIRNTGNIALVPTMGAFHEGHLSLMRKAKQECVFTVVSLFVNPLQFGPKEDYDVYPRNLASDRKMARSVGIDLLWTPSEKNLFPPAFQTRIQVPQLSHCLEGAARPDHFTGVATIVGILLNLVRPDRLYLGEKDFQQTRVIARLAADLHFDTQIRICPTVREKDGLAMSSRNARLTASERKAAPILYRALRQGQALVRGGTLDAQAVIQAVQSILVSEPGIKIEYIALCDPLRLEPIRRIKTSAVLLAAIRVGSVRLIDNVALKVTSIRTSGRADSLTMK